MESSSNPQRVSASWGIFDLGLLVAVCAVWSLIARLTVPDGATHQTLIGVAILVFPAGPAVFGPWLIRRQFVGGRRSELCAGEWLWVTLAAGWLAALPPMLAGRMPAAGLGMFAALVAVGTGVLGLTGLLLSVPRHRNLPLTHWLGLVIALAHPPAMACGMAVLRAA